MHRFRFHPADVSDDNVVILSKDESRHALKVLRLKPGDAVELLDGKDKKFRGFVVGQDKGLVEVSVDQNPIMDVGAYCNTPLKKTNIILAVSVIKPERMEWLIQKAAEIGVTRIVPVLAARSVVKLSRERWVGKVERWRKIVLEACKQCGRAAVPEVADPVDFKTLVKSVNPEDLFIFPTLAVAGKNLQFAVGAMCDSRLQKNVVIAIGPEGDFTAEETRLALTRGAVPVSLGETVLRSETAAIYLLSIIRFAMLNNA